MIMFDGARVRRSLSVDVAVGATLLAVEGVILGRTAMGEELRSARIRDGWRVRRAGALIYADAFVADGDLRGDLAGQTPLPREYAFLRAGLPKAVPDSWAAFDVSTLAADRCVWIEGDAVSLLGFSRGGDRIS